MTKEDKLSVEEKTERHLDFLAREEKIKVLGTSIGMIGAGITLILFGTLLTFLFPIFVIFTVIGIIIIIFGILGTIGSAKTKPEDFVKTGKWRDKQK